MTIEDTAGWYSLNGGPQITGPMTLTTHYDSDATVEQQGFNGRYIYTSRLFDTTLNVGSFSAHFDELPLDSFVQTQGSDGGRADALGFGWRLSYGSAFTVGPGAFWTSPQNRSVGGVPLTYLGLAGTGSPFDGSPMTSLTVAVSPAPEPETIALMSMGLVGLFLRRRRPA
jgi:hypothetical protein